MTGVARHVAVYRHEQDVWLVAVDGVPGCHTYGRTLRQAGERIREALAVWLDSDPADLDLEHRWPPEVADLAAAVADARRAAAEASAAASAATVEAARRLAAMGLSRRDAAEVLGVSHQRVQQLLAS